MTDSWESRDRLPDLDLAEIEQVAVELAVLAGAQISAALGRSLTVRYKGEAAGGGSLKDPVSEVDQRVEQLVRARLADHFPEHDIIGEEVEERTGRSHDLVWAIDPVDGTTNFINGFPLFAGSIGVLYRGRPVVGAIWCSTSHSLRPGVYHARQGGLLCFDGDAVMERSCPDVRRRLVGMPKVLPDIDLSYDIRKTGSAALECAMVAAGLLTAARFARPNLWDVAGGVALVRAAGRKVEWRASTGWTPLEHFEPPVGADGRPDLRSWRAPLVIGDPDAIEAIREAV
ncbi:inositol monophosphatase [Azospirillum sp. SYSU D00513]|uniref:inositol monophosphatase family protein n=1 Tax=Azospirillum sp. SYSU D00513 TaxID=2812561 RepID=UPI001A95E7E7|nr:inositol monophosphatase [Azospirillum sp. SYSU D00513]